MGMELPTNRAHVWTMWLTGDSSSQALSATAMVLGHDNYLVVLADAVEFCQDPLLSSGVLAQLSNTACGCETSTAPAHQHKE